MLASITVQYDNQNVYTCNYKTTKRLFVCVCVREHEYVCASEHFVLLPFCLNIGIHHLSRFQLSGLRDSKEIPQFSNLTNAHSSVSSFVHEAVDSIWLL